MNEVNVEASTTIPSRPFPFADTIELLSMSMTALANARPSSARVLLADMSELKAKKPEPELIEMPRSTLKLARSWVLLMNRFDPVTMCTPMALLPDMVMLASWVNTDETLCALSPKLPAF